MRNKVNMIYIEHPGFNRKHFSSIRTNLLEFIFVAGFGRILQINNFVKLDIRCAKMHKPILSCASFALVLFEFGIFFCIIPIQH